MSVWLGLESFLFSSVLPATFLVLSYHCSDFVIGIVSFHLYLQLQEALPQFFSVRGPPGACCLHVASQVLSHLVASEPG